MAILLVEAYVNKPLNALCAPSATTMDPTGHLLKPYLLMADAYCFVLWWVGPNLVRIWHTCGCVQQTFVWGDGLQVFPGNVRIVMH